MKTASLIGIVLIVLGVIGLAVGHIDFTTQKKVLDIGPIHATADESHHLRIPDIAAVIALLAGVGLVFTGQKRIKS